MNSRAPTGVLTRARHRLTRWGIRILAPVAALAAAGLGMASLAGAAPAAAAVTSPAAPTASCAVIYQVTSAWQTGFTASITVTNDGPAITAWTLQYSYTGGQQLQNGWNGNWSQAGQTVTVTNAAWDGSLSPGASVTAGAVFSSSGTSASPPGFTLNGTACTAGPQPAVTITSPPSGTLINQGTPVTLSATADADGLGTVTSVSYFATPRNGGTEVIQIGSATAPPYTVTWPDAPVLNWALWATVTTSTGATATSTTPVELSVGVNGTPPP